MIYRFGRSGYSNSRANYGAKIIKFLQKSFYSFHQIPVISTVGKSSIAWPTVSKSLGRSDDGSDGGAIEPRHPNIIEVIGVTVKI